MSTVALFGLLAFPVMIFVAILVTRLSVHLCLYAWMPGVSVLYPHCGQWAYPTWRRCPLCWSDGLSNYQKGWIPHPDWSPMSVLSPLYQDRGGGMPSAVDTTLPRLEDTSGGKSGKCPGMHWEGLKPQTPSTWPPPLQ